MRILLINPNTSASISERMAVPARAALLPGEHLATCTASQGPAVIQSPEQARQAAQTVLQLAQAHGGAHDALIVGMSLDSGLRITRDAMRPRPVIGMTEAACLVACLQGERFGVLTLGQDMVPLYAAHIAELGLAGRLIGVAAAQWPDDFDPAEMGVQVSLLQALAQAAQPLLQQGASSVVLAGAVLCGYGPALAERLGQPVLEGTACAVGLARCCIRQRRPPQGSSA
ncbi:aspartate/glutamate racemase family protein [Corticibacter populi]|nr:aspartate/glutamate racemase family protein [Corticibacter populi]